MAAAIPADAEGPGEPRSAPGPGPGTPLCFSRARSSRGPSSPAGPRRRALRPWRRFPACLLIAHRGRHWVPQPPACAKRAPQRRPHPGTSSSVVGARLGRARPSIWGRAGSATKESRVSSWKRNSLGEGTRPGGERDKELVQRRGSLTPAGPGPGPGPGAWGASYRRRGTLHPAGLPLAPPLPSP